MSNLKLIRLFKLFALLSVFHFIFDMQKTALTGKEAKEAIFVGKGIMVPAQVELKYIGKRQNTAIEISRGHSNIRFDGIMTRPLTPNHLNFRTSNSITYHVILQIGEREFHEISGSIRRFRNNNLYASFLGNVQHA
ncbi:hypothetical protein ABEB36_004778 [Hypothenemus hampei]|uniref:Uncharacterized protein n=1 Tax=Hypothenemus hampei TaxID=57062 RepID=A0ABD1EVS9_HYPHA